MTKKQNTNDIFNKKDIIDSINNGGILPYFQPILCNKTDKIVKFEALARLQIKDKIVSPASFLDAAYEEKLQNEILCQMVDKSLEIFRDDDFKKFHVSFNISKLTIQSNEYIDYLIQKIKDFKYPENIVLELLETEELSKEATRGFIEKFKNLNIKVSIDDFGTGYSNLDTLISYPFHFLKIDGSLIRSILTNESKERTLFHINEIATINNYKTIAEFVSDEKTFLKIKELGIAYSQGYYISKPLDPRDIKTFLEKFNRRELNV